MAPTPPNPPTPSSDPLQALAFALEKYPERVEMVPVDRLVSGYRFGDIQRAIADMESGQVIKPILRMTNDDEDSE